MNQQSFLGSLVLFLVGIRFFAEPFVDRQYPTWGVIGVWMVTILIVVTFTAVKVWREAAAIGLASFVLGTTVLILIGILFVADQTFSWSRESWWDIFWMAVLSLAYALIPIRRTTTSSRS